MFNSCTKYTTCSSSLAWRVLLYVICFHALKCFPSLHFFSSLPPFFPSYSASCSKLKKKCILFKPALLMFSIFNTCIYLSRLLLMFSLSHFLFTHALTHPLPNYLTYLLTQLFTHSFNSLTSLLTYSITHSFKHCHTLTHYFSLPLPFSHSLSLLLSLSLSFFLSLSSLSLSHCITHSCTQNTLTNINTTTNIKHTQDTPNKMHSLFLVHLLPSINNNNLGQVI